MNENIKEYIDKHKWISTLFFGAIALIIILLTDAWMFFLMSFMADYLVIGLNLLIILVALFLLGKKLGIQSQAGAWLLLSSLCVGGLMIIYAHGLGERGIEDNRTVTWNIAGLILFNLPIAKAIISHFVLKRKQGSQVAPLIGDKESV